MKKKLLTIPNILSVFRIILAVLFLGIYLKWGMDEKRTVLVGILIISGFSDFMDGKIARKFNMVSELGKMLDPIADKLTQAVPTNSKIYCGSAYYWIWNYVDNSRNSVYKAFYKFAKNHKYKKTK